ncbi:MAG: hypothetical protein J6Y02_21025 [Pseudobutyrivibrio sp.]|nr:hypothetical protein [Pseudobutyrivibrio sp.]
MAVRRFATNNLVKDHDNYVKFMKTRLSHLSKEDKNTDILLYKKGLVTEAFGIKYSKEHKMDVTVQITKYVRTIKLWHSITIAYNIWCEYSKFYIDKDHNLITYKQFVDIPEGVLKKFKFRFEQTVKNAKCEYKTKGGDHSVDPCRLLAMFWTYLDLVKDTKTQRYLPNIATIERAVKVFGYKKFDNPFIMNGAFTKRCVRDKKEEEKPVEETTKYNLNLDASIDEFDFTTRTRNGLWRAGYRKLGDIINLKYENLIKIRNLGLVSTREILEKLNEIRSQSESEAKEESVIDIAEQAAKEVEEEQKFSWSELFEKYNNLNADYDKLLKQNHDLVSYNSSLREEIEKLKDNMAELRSREAKLNIAANPKNIDTFTLLNTVLEKMKDSKMEYILLTIDGMTIDIHPAKSFPIKSAYQIRSSER